MPGGGDTLPRRTAREMIREALRRDLVPGDRLASEPVLLSYFGVSRASLREALRMLSFLGAIEVRSGPGGGSRIAMPQPRVVGSALAMTLQFRGTTLRTLLEAREAMEPPIASLAATRRKDQDLAALESCLERLAGTVNTGDFQQESHRFHKLVATAAGNEALAVLVPALTWMSTAMEWGHGPKTQQRLVDERTKIVEAIRDRDPAVAYTHAAKLFRRMLNDLERHQPRELVARINWPDVDELLNTDTRKDDAPWM